MPLREVTLANSDQEFILAGIAKKYRLDQRQPNEFRKLTINFGLEYGYCYVSLGETKILAQVTADIDLPKESRPNEGSLSIHLEISTLAAGHFDPTKPGEVGTEIRQFLERSLLFSGAIDLEELCLRTGEKAWCINLYLHVLNYDGNILDCASVASITALKHFLRPSVKFSGRDIIVQKMEEGNPVALTINHMPFSVSFGFFKGGSYSLLDPTYAEEKVMDGKLLVSMNKHQQICHLLMSGNLQINKEQITKCTNSAAVIVKDLSDFVTKALDTDKERRKNHEKHLPIVANFSRKEVVEETFGFTKIMEEVKIDENDSDIADNQPESEPENTPVWDSLNENTSKIVGDGVVNSWFQTKDSEKKDIIEISDDDEEEEEETMTLGQKDVGFFK